MQLVSNWRAVFARAWSVRFILLAFLFTTLEVALPLLNAGNIPPGVFAALTGLCTGAAFVSRLVAQSSISGER